MTIYEWEELLPVEKNKKVLGLMQDLLHCYLTDNNDKNKKKAQKSASSNENLKCEDYTWKKTRKK